MINIFSSTTPLAANAVVQSFWNDVTGNGDVPYLVVTASSDQAGSFQVIESENETESNLLVGDSITPNAAPDLVTCAVGRRFVRVIYTNGPIAQNSFALNLWVTANPVLGTTRLLELILRELRMMSMLLETLAEPAGSTGVEPNMPIGVGQAGN